MYENICSNIVNFIKHEIEKRDSEWVIIGISGGIDSSLTTVLAVKAFRNQQVFDLLLPDSSITQSDTIDAIELSKS
jgi:NAD+ synthase